MDKPAIWPVFLDSECNNILRELYLKFSEDTKQISRRIPTIPEFVLSPIQQPASAAVKNAVETQSTEDAEFFPVQHHSVMLSEHDGHNNKNQKCYTEQHQTAKTYLQAQLNPYLNTLNS